MDDEGLPSSTIPTTTLIAQLRQSLASSDGWVLWSPPLGPPVKLSHSDVWRRASVLADQLGPLEGERAVVVADGLDWLVAFLAIRLAGGVCVPLSPLYPDVELSQLLADARPVGMVASAIYQPTMAALAGAIPLTVVDAAQVPSIDEVGDEGAAERAAPGDEALMLYTSGTTGKPKGAVLSERNLKAHTDALRTAWGITDADTLLHALPLHHLHGIVVALLTSLSAGASVHMLAKFDAAVVWNHVCAEGTEAPTVFMGVPTMYQRLCAFYASAIDQDRMRSAARKRRLFTSGSAALPQDIAGAWAEIAGVMPLERYGMTEIGIALSNPLPPAGRVAGSVGYPLGDTSVALRDDEGQWLEGPGTGEVYVQGPSVFSGYWDRPDANEDAFYKGWFRTGDRAEREADGRFRLLGRTSVDILKSGGYKLSALEIEAVLREHPAIADVAVVGVADPAWGDRVVAVICAHPDRDSECMLEPLRAWAKQRLAPYKIPRQVVLQQALPRNSMGKVVKSALIAQLSEPITTADRPKNVKNSP